MAALTLVMFVMSVCFAFVCATTDNRRRLRCVEVDAKGALLGYVSLTTTPERICNDWIQRNMTRLLNIVPASLGVVMHVPHISRKGVPYAVPKTLEELAASSKERFIINRDCEDLGPITKIIPALSLSCIKDSQYVIVVDDDTCYKVDAFRSLLCALNADDSVVYALCSEDILGYQGYAFRKGLLHNLRYLSIPESCWMIDDDVVEYFIKDRARLRVQAVSLGNGGRTCSFDRKLTYQRPHKAWNQISNTLSRHHSSMKNKCLKDLRRNTAKDA